MYMAKQRTIQQSEMEGYGSKGLVDSNMHPNLNYKPAK